jgi:hypothetical protein
MSDIKKLISIKFRFGIFYNLSDEFYFIEYTIHANALKVLWHLFQYYELPGTGLLRISLEFKYGYPCEEQWLL